jgi:hypothetical protein
MFLIHLYWLLFFFLYLLAWVQTGLFAIDWFCSIGGIHSAVFSATVVRTVNSFLRDFLIFQDPLFSSLSLFPKRIFFYLKNDVRFQMNCAILQKHFFPHGEFNEVILQKNYWIWNLIYILLSHKKSKKDNSYCRNKCKKRLPREKRETIA